MAIGVIHFAGCAEHRRQISERLEENNFAWEGLIKLCRLVQATFRDGSAYKFITKGARDIGIGRESDILLQLVVNVNIGREVLRVLNDALNINHGWSIFI